MHDSYLPKKLLAKFFKILFFSQKPCDNVTKNKCFFLKISLDIKTGKNLCESRVFLICISLCSGHLLNSYQQIWIDTFDDFSEKKTIFALNNFLPSYCVGSKTERSQAFSKG
jgi:hypothetical protein